MKRNPQSNSRPGIYRWSNSDNKAYRYLAPGNYSILYYLMPKMEFIKKQNAVTAFLVEYKKAIIELQNIIADINEVELVKILDPQTPTVECRSIQTVLTHVISSGYSYCIYIQNHRNINTKRQAQSFLLSCPEYSHDLDRLLEFTYQTFSGIYDNELEEFNDSKKIVTQWGQSYDIEQMMEHAIVHILKHRRQIANFKKLLRRL